LQSWPTERNELFAMYEKTCERDADSLNSGISKAEVCVESMVSPVGSLTHSAVSERVLLQHVALTNKK
jgi:hypothetical protein